MSLEWVPTWDVPRLFSLSFSLLATKSPLSVCAMWLSVSALTNDIGQFILLIGSLLQQASYGRLTERCYYFSCLNTPFDVVKWFFTDEWAVYFFERVKREEICYEVFSSHEECNSPGKVKRGVCESEQIRNAIIFVFLSKISCFSIRKP